MSRILCLSFAAAVLVHKADAAGVGDMGDKDMARSQSSWTYANRDRWGETFPGCLGSSQSPVDISVAPKNITMSVPVRYGSNYNTPLLYELENNGHTAELLLREESIPQRPQLMVGSEVFRFEQFHFHWGQTDRDGSEHGMYGAKFPLEMHLVHSNVRFPNTSAALGQPNGIAVVGFLFTPSRRTNRAFKQITDNLPQIIEDGRRVDLVQGIALTALLPQSLDDVYMYNGSLTTPPCTENISWILSNRVIGMASAQLAAFRQLRERGGAPNDMSFRNLQNLSGRTVQQTFQNDLGSSK